MAKTLAMKIIMAFMFGFADCATVMIEKDADLMRKLEETVDLDSSAQVSSSIDHGNENEEDEAEAVDGRRRKCNRRRRGGQCSTRRRGPAEIAATSPAPEAACSNVVPNALAANTCQDSGLLADLKACGWEHCDVCNTGTACGRLYCSASCSQSDYTDCFNTFQSQCGHLWSWSNTAGVECTCSLAVTTGAHCPGFAVPSGCSSLADIDFAKTNDTKGSSQAPRQTPPEGSLEESLSGKRSC